MDNTAASTERTIHIRICHRLWFRAFNMYIFKIPGFYECPISWVHFNLVEFTSGAKPIIPQTPAKITVF